MTKHTSAAIDQFATLAASYCALIESHADYTTEAFIDKVRELLPQLYYQALQLPDLPSAGEHPLSGIEHEDWKPVFAQLQEKLGPNDLYWEVFDPLKVEPEEPVAGSLADDLADIWRDLKVGLIHWQTDSAETRQDVNWQWRFHFQVHWSYHVVDALRALNAIAESYGARE